MSKDIYVFAEQRDGNVQKVALELIGKGRELAADLDQDVIAVLLGSNIKEKADQLIAGGADKVIVIDHPVLAEYTTEPYAKAITAVIRAKDPEIVLVGATAIGRDLAPRVSARVHTGLTADCTKLEIDETTKLHDKATAQFEEYKKKSRKRLLKRLFTDHVMIGLYILVIAIISAAVAATVVGM